MHSSLYKGNVRKERKRQIFEKHVKNLRGALGLAVNQPVNGLEWQLGAMRGSVCLDLESGWESVYLS